MPVEYGGGLVRTAPDVRFLSKEARSGYEMRPEIVGLGKSRGTKNVTNEDIANLINATLPADKQIPPKVFDRLARRTGVVDRGWNEVGEGASVLAIKAIPMALEMANVSLDDIKALNVATGLPDYFGVPTGVIIMMELGGHYDISTDDTSAACPGFLHVLRKTYSDVSSQYGLGGPQLAVAAEPASKGINPLNHQTFPIFGDGGAAVVIDMIEVNKKEPKARFVHRIDPSLLYKLYVPAGGSRRRVDEAALRDNLDSIHMEGEEVKQEAIKRLIEVSKEVLRLSKMTVDDIDLFIPHQANLQIIKPVGEALKFREEKVMINIDHYGNTSAASMPIAMREAYEQGRLKRGDRVLLATFGAGLNFGAAVLPMNGLPEAA